MRPLTTDPRFQPQFQPLASPSLPPADVVDFRGYFKVETFGHGAVIYRPGLPADKVYLLRLGRVRLLRQGKGKSRSVLSILKPGAGRGRDPGLERARSPAAPAGARSHPQGRSCPPGRDADRAGPGARRADRSWKRALPAWDHPAGPRRPGRRVPVVRLHPDQQDETRWPAREPGTAPGAARRGGPESGSCPREVSGLAAVAAWPRSPPWPRWPPPPFLSGRSNPPSRPVKREGPLASPRAALRVSAKLGLGGFLLLLGLVGLRFLLGGGLLLGRGRGSVGVLLLEAIDAALGIDQLLLAGEEGVAIAADIEVKVAVRGAGLPGGAARAVDLGGGIGGMDVLAHVCFSRMPADCSRCARGH